MAYGAGFRWHASIPQAARLDYKKRPESLVAADPVAARKTVKKDKMTKKLEGLSRSQKLGRAVNLSVEGRGLS
jgi:transcription factor SPN1